MNPFQDLPVADPWFRTRTVQLKELNYVESSVSNNHTTIYAEVATHGTVDRSDLLGTITGAAA
jgi:hypothetical protein